MLRVRSRIYVSPLSKDRLTIQSSVSRRLLFGAIAALLIAAFFVSVDWQEDFDRRIVAGSIFYFAIIAICGGIAAWNRHTLLDKTAGTITTQRRVFGIRLQEERSEATVEAVVLQTVRLLREAELPRRGGMMRSARGFAERRSTYHKLYLDTSSGRRFIDDSTDASDLQPGAATIAEFYGVELREEEV